MASGTIAFLLGVISFQQFPELPPLRWLLLLAAGVLLSGLLAALLAALLAGSRAAPLLRGLALLGAGLGWAAFRATLLLADGLPTHLEGVDLVAEGVVCSLPEEGGRRLRFQLDTERLIDGEEPIPFAGRLRLAWYDDPPPLHAGERWRLTVRLKRPRGMANPGGFDYEAWLFQQGIRATGYVRGGGENRRLDARFGNAPVQRVRERLKEGIDQTLGQAPLAGIILALAIGEQARMDPDDWEVLTATGTNHLMAISGLHVGMVAALGYLAALHGWRRSGLLLRFPAPKAAAIGTFSAALLYSLLAGMSVPTQRTLVMIAVVSAALLAQRSLRPRDTLALAAWALLLFDPLAVLSPGFWLSFGAVALIFFGMGGRLGQGGLWWRWGRVQWLVAVGITPLLVLFFGTASISSPLANLVAVPWVSLVVVPVTLLGTLLVVPFPALGGPLLQLALWLIGLLWPLLAALARWLPPLGLPEPPFGALLLAFIGTAWLLAPRGWPARGAALFLLLPAIFWRPERPGPGEAWLTLLDVGQGLAAVVETEGHTLVYDAGPRFGPSFDAGEAVVGPFLRHRGVKALDLLIVSHGGNDHIGGARSLTAALPVGAILTGVPDRIGWARAMPCLKGQQWQWDGVTFDILHPTKSEPDSDNDGSCVVRVGTPAGAILLTGDMEARAEGELVKSGLDLRARVLVVPHHGSKSSSTEEFLEAVRPEYALFSVGYRNRFRHPDPMVVARYEARGVYRLDTATSGAVTLRMGGGAVRVEGHREAARRYWQGE